MKRNDLMACIAALGLGACGAASAAAVVTSTMSLQIELVGATSLEWNRDAGTTLETWSLEHILHSVPWATRASGTREIYDWDRVPGWTPVPEAFSISFAGSSVSNANAAIDPFKPTATTSAMALHDGSTSAGYVVASGQYVHMVVLHVPGDAAAGQFSYKARIGGSGSVQTGAAGEWGQVSQSLSSYVLRGHWLFDPDINWGYIEYENANLFEDGFAQDWPDYFRHADGADGSYAADNLHETLFEVDYQPGDYFLIRTDSMAWAQAFAPAGGTPPVVPEPGSLLLALVALIGAATGSAPRARGRA
jgi:hypothetical protein